MPIQYNKTIISRCEQCNWDERINGNELHPVISAQICNSCESCCSDSETDFEFRFYDSEGFEVDEITGTRLSTEPFKVARKLLGH